jgi:hypothetical protein
MILRVGLKQKERKIGWWMLGSRWMSQWMNKWMNEEEFSYQFQPIKNKPGFIFLLLTCLLLLPFHRVPSHLLPTSTISVLIIAEFNYHGTIQSSHYGIAWNVW